MKTVTKVATHAGLFHADEVTAVALLRCVENFGEVVVDRLPHQTGEDVLSQYDLVVDIGRVHDTAGGRFDHHQTSPAEGESRAAAGLVWSWLKESGMLPDVPMINQLIQLVDENDTGVRPSAPFELPAIVSRFNAQNPFGPEQEASFEAAVSFVEGQIRALLAEFELHEEAKAVAAAAKPSEIKGVVELPKFNRLWSHYINGEATPEIEVVVWYDAAQKQWSAQTTPKQVGSFERTGRGIRALENLPEGMKFAHKGEFFACAETREALMSYLQENLV